MGDGVVVQGREEILRRTPTLFPQTFTLDNFRQLFTATDYSLYLKNSFIIALFTVLFTVLVAFCGAYGLYRMQIPGGKKVAGAILLAYMIPGTLLLVPLYQVFAQLQLVNTRTALVIVNVPSPPLSARGCCGASSSPSPRTSTRRQRSTARARCGPCARSCFPCWHQG